MKEMLIKVVGGFLFGLGFSAALAVSYQVVILSDASDKDRREHYVRTAPPEYVTAQVESASGSVPEWSIAILNKGERPIIRTEFGVRALLNGALVSTCIGRSEGIPANGSITALVVCEDMDPEAVSKLEIQAFVQTVWYINEA